MTNPNLRRTAQRTMARLQRMTLTTVSIQTCQLKGLVRAVHFGTILGLGLTNTLREFLLSLKHAKLQHTIPSESKLTGLIVTCALSKDSIIADITQDVSP